MNPLLSDSADTHLLAMMGALVAALIYIVKLIINHSNKQVDSTNKHLAELVKGLDRHQQVEEGALEGIDSELKAGNEKLDRILKISEDCRACPLDQTAIRMILDAAQRSAPEKEKR
ncbi:MAG: hypothetical protein E6R03_03560 [Hyphomicrobiaceae bacterium]|nr:MAG: hypothetical protein E6R03_03560 [Hyphomicrobiaceae bacterium]